MSTEKILSRFTHVVRISEEVVVLWNSMWLRPVFVTNPLAQYIEKWEPGESLVILSRKFPQDLIPDFKALLPVLKKEKFLVKASEDVKKLQEVQGTAERLPIAIMYLILAGTCNLRCSGCYLRKTIYGGNSGFYGKIMSTKVIKDSLDMFKRVTEKSGVRNPEIVLYGGEPLLNKKGFEFSLQYARQLMPECTFTLNTNAVLVTPDIVKLLKQYDVGVAVSIDGPKEVHDRLRPDTFGNGTFDRVLEGFYMLQRSGVRVSISCTMLPSNVGSTTKTVEWFIADLGVKSFDLNLFLGRLASNNLNTYAKLASNALLESYKIARGSGVYLDRVMRKLNPFVEGRLVFNGCGACGQQIVVTPSGWLGVCQAEMNDNEDFIRNEGRMFDPSSHAIWKRWRRRSPFNISACLSCEVLGICGGGCPYNAKLSFGNIMGLDEAHYVFAKASLRFFLQELWKETNT